MGKWRSNNVLSLLRQISLIISRDGEEEDSLKYGVYTTGNRGHDAYAVTVSHVTGGVSGGAGLTFDAR